MLWNTSRLCLILLLSLSSIQKGNAQYKLPNFQLIKDEGIRAITVIKRVHAIHKPKGAKWDTDSSFFKRKGPINTYYFNPQGLLDSVYYYPDGEGKYYQKDIMRYDSLGRMVEIWSLSREGAIRNRTLVESMDSAGCWYLRYWNQGFLGLEWKLRADSIIFEYTMHRGSPKYPTYMIYRYDFDKEMRSETWYDRGEMTSRRTYQWIAVEGMPKQFIYFEYVKGEDPDPDAGLYEVDSTGMVINDQNGFFTDPFMSHNYFERYEKLRALNHPHASQFSLDTIAGPQLYRQLWTFDGVEIEWEYTFEYQRF